MRIAIATLLLCLSSYVTATEVLLTTNKGDIRLELDEQAAPNTVANFLAYVKDGHYDSTQFHRVIEGFMIQGGGFDADFNQVATRDPIRNEADNGLRNTPYSIAMARTGDPHSATAQFFINVADNKFLNFTDKSQRGWGYAVFGRVIEGEHVVDDIAEISTGSRGPFGRDVPLEPVVIVRAEIVSAD